MDDTELETEDDLEEVFQEEEKDLQVDEAKEDLTQERVQGIVMDGRNNIDYFLIKSKIILIILDFFMD